MTTKKRSAEPEPTSNSGTRAVPESTQGDSLFEFNRMDAVRGWFRSFGDWLWGSTYADMTIPDTNPITEPHTRTPGNRFDGRTTAKRQKRRSPIQFRSRSADHNHTMHARGAAASRDRDTNDRYWQPKGHQLLRKKPIPVKSEASQQRRSLDYTPTSTRTTPSEPPSPLEQEPFILYSRSLSFGLKSSDLDQSQTNQQQHNGESSKETEIAKSLEQLLLSGKQDESTLLTPSSTKQEKIRAKQEEQRLADEAAKKKLAEEEKQAELDAKKASRLKRREPYKGIVQPLNGKWESRVAEAESNRDFQQVLTKSIGGTELAVKDFAKLLGHRSWLNDEVVNAYIEWITDAANQSAKADAATRGEPLSKVPQFIAHNSFFYENLSKKGPASIDRLMKRKGAPGKSLLEVDTIFIPICQGSHWTMGVVRPVAKTIEYFDSMWNTNDVFFSLMRSWLSHQLAEDYIADEWKTPNTTCARQSNGFDCGVFVCTNAFCVGFGLETSSYEERDMTQQRRNIAAVLLNRGFVGDFGWDQLGL